MSRDYEVPHSLLIMYVQLLHFQRTYRAKNPNFLKIHIVLKSECLNAKLEPKRTYWTAIFWILFVPRSLILAFLPIDFDAYQPLEVLQL